MMSLGPGHMVKNSSKYETKWCQTHKSPHIEGNFDYFTESWPCEIKVLDKGIAWQIIVVNTCWYSVTKINLSVQIKGMVMQYISPLCHVIWEL